jgi:GTP-binding protein Era
VSRSGFVGLAGRPNVGKSTLVNAVVGEKIAIVSDKPQTTRRAIRAVHHGARAGVEYEVVLVDLPGVQRPRDALTARMARRVNDELDGSDAALLMLSAEEGVGPGDRFIAHTLQQTGLPVVLAVNKRDRVRGAALAPVLAQASDLVPDAEVFPISARSGAGLDELLGHLGSLMPEGPFCYPDGALSDQPLAVLLAELIREAVLRRTFQELPHAVEVMVEEIERPRAGLTRVRALLWVESESQKGILIGARGRMIKAIGTAARRELERVLGTRVHLDLSVRVRRDWRADESLLDRLGM